MSTRKNEAKWIESLERWQINVQRDGERRTFTDTDPTTKGKIKAEHKSDKWLESKTQNENIRFGVLWSELLEEVKECTGKGNYDQKHQIGEYWLLPTLKHKKAANITEQDWQDCINAAFTKGRAKKTLQNIRGCQVAVAKYARKRRIPLQYPENVVIPKGAQTKGKKILQPDAINKLFEIDYIMDHGKEKKCFLIYAWRFFVLTGLRRGELCGLQNDDIDNRIADLKHSVNKYLQLTDGKNQNAQREVRLSTYAEKTLQDQRNLLKSKSIISPWVFPDENGKRLNPNHLYKTWYAYRNQHGLNCSLHELRHTFISLSKADVPEQLLKKMVGHSEKMDTFGVYGHKVDGEMDKVSTILDTIFDGVFK